MPAQETCRGLNPRLFGWRRRREEGECSLPEPDIGESVRKLDQNPGTRGPLREEVERTSQGAFPVGLPAFDGIQPRQSNHGVQFGHFGPLVSLECVTDLGSPIKRVEVLYQSKGLTDVARVSSSFSPGLEEEICEPVDTRAANGVGAFIRSSCRAEIAAIHLTSLVARLEKLVALDRDGRCSHEDNHPPCGIARKVLAGENRIPFRCRQIDHAERRLQSQVRKIW
jgi:hypothetical protein